MTFESSEVSSDPGRARAAALGEPGFAWPKALYLHERAAFGRPATVAGKPPDSPRLRRYLAQAPFDEAAMLRVRLQEDQLDEEAFRYLLGTPAERLPFDRSSPPAWVSVLQALYRAPREPAGDDPVATLIEPLLDDAEERLARLLVELFPPAAPLTVELQAVLAALRRELHDKLGRECRRAVVLELHAARELGLLSGESPQERLRDFCRQLAAPVAASELFDSFPLLGRRLVEHQERFLAASGEMFERLRRDQLRWSTLLADRGDRELRLVGVEGGLSDPHRGGRGVHFLQFAGGEKLVYKPKNLGAEVAFGRLLGWLEQHGLAISLRALRVVDCGDYGWAEMIERGVVHSLDEVREFYRRQGAFLALLHTLQAVDFHHENLIAAGAFPVLVDLECLFHPQIDAVAGSSGVGSTSIDAYLDTVHAIGFLPQRIWDGDGSSGLDISGLGAQSGRQSPHAVPMLVGLGSDRMQIGSGVIALPDPVSRPRFGGVEPRLEDFGEELVAGFCETYRFVVRHRHQLLAADGPIPAFAKVRQRVLLRATSSYLALLEAASHPHVLGDALDADQLYDRLWSVLAVRPWLRGIVGDERQAVGRGDVPMFHGEPGSRDLWTCGDRRLADFFAETGLERVSRRISRMDEDDLEKQARIVRGTLESVALSSQPTFWPQHQLSEVELGRRDGADFRQAALHRAAELAQRLEKLEVRRDDGSFFFAQRPTGGGAFTYDPIGFDLYRGQAGIALFHAQLFALTGEPRAAAAARRVIAPVLATFELSPLVIPNIGAFGGWAGVGYTLERLARLLGEPGLDRLAASVPSKIAALLSSDRTYDVMGGAAGAILYLLRRFRRCGASELLELAIKAGDHLLKETWRPGQGWSWPAATGPMLAGLSHGSGGIAWALLELAAASGQELFAVAARDAISYERGLFRPAHGNWVDLRPLANEAGREEGAREEHFLCAWCHGAVGIGLARHHSRELLPAAEQQAAAREIEVAITTALRDGFGSSHCLCHGDLGSLDFLEEVARGRGDRELEARVDRLAGGLLASLERDGWRCGLSNGVEQPGLFLGLAGIGYGLLRLARPDLVPSVLAFEPG